MRLKENPVNAVAPVIEVEIVPAARSMPEMLCDACSEWCRPAVVIHVQDLLMAVCEQCFGPGSADHVRNLLGCIRKRYVRAVDVLSKTAAAGIVKTAASAAAPPQDPPAAPEDVTADHIVMH